MNLDTREYVIDAANFETRYQAHEYMKEIFSGLEYYGNNLDALHDVLTSIGFKTQVTIMNLESAREKIGDYADRIAEVFRDSEKENRFLTVIFE